MPGKKKKYNARFPPARIKKIMQCDEDVGKVAAAVPVMISRALELFIGSLMRKTSEETKARNAKTLRPYHLKQTIESNRMYDFLRGVVAHVTQVEEDGEGESVSGNGPPKAKPFYSTIRVILFKCFCIFRKGMILFGSFPEGMYRRKANDATASSSRTSADAQDESTEEDTETDDEANNDDTEDDETFHKTTDETFHKTTEPPTSMSRAHTIDPPSGYDAEKSASHTSNIHTSNVYRSDTHTSDTFIGASDNSNRHISDIPPTTSNLSSLGPASETYIKHRSNDMFIGASDSRHVSHIPPSTSNLGSLGPASETYTKHHSNAYTSDMSIGASDNRHVPHIPPTSNLSSPASEMYTKHTSKQSGANHHQNTLSNHLTSTNENVGLHPPSNQCTDFYNTTTANYKQELNSTPNRNLDNQTWHCPSQTKPSFMRHPGLPSEPTNHTTEPVISTNHSAEMSLRDHLMRPAIANVNYPVPGMPPNMSPYHNHLPSYPNMPPLHHKPPYHHPTYPAPSPSWIPPHLSPHHLSSPHPSQSGSLDLSMSRHNDV